MPVLRKKPIKIGTRQRNFTEWAGGGGVPNGVVDVEMLQRRLAQGDPRLFLVDVVTVRPAVLETSQRQTALQHAPQLQVKNTASADCQQQIALCRVHSALM